MCRCREPHSSSSDAVSSAVLRRGHLPKPLRRGARGGHAVASQPVARHRESVRSQARLWRMQATIPILSARGQRLQWRTRGRWSNQWIEVRSRAGVVATLENGEADGILKGSTTQESWVFIGKGFRDAGADGESWPPLPAGAIEFGSAITFPDAMRFEWRNVSFWRSRDGYFEESGDRCLIELSVGNSIWIHATERDSPYIAVLLFAGVFHRRFGTHKATALSKL